MLGSAPPHGLAREGGTVHGFQSGTGFRPENHQKPRCALRAILVHRCARQHEIVCRHPQRARGRLCRRHGLRRQLHRGLLPHRGVRHAGVSRRLHVPGAAVAPGEQRRGAHVLRHPHARRQALRRRSALCAGARGGQGAGHGVRVQRRPRGGVLLLQGRRGHRAFGPWRLFRPDQLGLR